MKPKKILIVDDEEYLVEIVTDQVKFMGYQTISFTDSLKAQEYLKHNDVNLVISDIRMPGLTGDKLLQWIQESMVNKPKVVFMSGFSELNRERALAEGAEELLTKPFCMSDLENTLFKAIGNAADSEQSQNIDETDAVSEVA